MEVLPGIHMIKGQVGGRPLQLYLLVGERPVLLDTGISSDPDELILPYMESIGFSPEELFLIINTHADLDHIGGNARMKEVCPNALLSCGHLDRPLVQNPEVIWKRRYNAYEADHGIHYDEDTMNWILGTLGRPQPIDLTWRGGEAFRISSDWTIEILHTPGHTHGHLTIFSAKHDAALIGDAVHGRVYYGIDGKEALCPTYLYVENYLATIGQIETLNPQTMLSCHWAVWTGDQVQDFLSESRQFVDRVDKAIVEVLQSENRPLSLWEMIEALSPRLGNWPRSVDIELAYAMNGHLERLTALGILTVDSKHPCLYTLM